MNAYGVLGAKPVAASGAVRVGRRSMAGLGRQSVGASSFSGNTRSLKARATMGRRVAAPLKLDIRAEKVVGIDLGTTNSAVRTRSIVAIPTALSAFLRTALPTDGGIVLRAQGLGGDAHARGVASVNPAEARGRD